MSDPCRMSLRDPRDRIARLSAIRVDVRRRRRELSAPMRTAATAAIVDRLLSLPELRADVGPTATGSPSTAPSTARSTWPPWLRSSAAVAG